MPSFRTGTVDKVLSERDGLQRVTVGGEPAYVLTQLTGSVAPGDEVVVNTTAVELGLGTGGWHVVHWNLSRREWSAPGGGHIMKLRYTSLQVDTGAADESADESSEAPLARVPVVACTLHSQVACVAASFAHSRPDARLVYVMTDGAALPLALSDLVAALIEAGLVAGTVTAGHAFGGDLEAVCLPSALALARSRLHADAIVAGMGPGVVGTGSRLGTTAVEAAGILDITAGLGGDPIIAVRASTADLRDRHQGLSHHTLTVLDLSWADVSVPLAAGAGLSVDHPRHEVAEVEVPDMAELLARFGLDVTTMGRSPAEDPLFFATAGAAGVAAARSIPA